MAKIDLVITNPGHHWTMVKPVASCLVAHGHRCRIVSLCEVRGSRTPEATADMEGVEVRTVVPRVRRGGPSKTGTSAVGARDFVRTAAWQFVVGPALRRTLASSRPDVVVVPNDSLFPCAPYVDLLHRRSIPVVLLQEGVLYAFTDSAPIRPVGRGIVDAVAAWGEASAEYFRSVGMDGDRIRVTGSPRHDHVTRDAFEPRARTLREELAAGGPLLVLMTNPVDTQGYCSAEEKLEMVRVFLDGLAPLAEKASLRVALKPHSGEDAADYARVVESSLLRERTTVVSGSDPYPFLVAADAVVVLGSTVGLEALMVGTPLGALQMPGGMFLFDYVDAGVAEPIKIDDVASSVEALLASPGSSDEIDSYLEHHMAHRGGAAERVAELVGSLAAGATT